MLIHCSLPLEKQNFVSFFVKVFPGNFMRQKFRIFVLFFLPLTFWIISITYIQSAHLYKITNKTKLSDSWGLNRIILAPTSGWAVLRSKLVDGRCQVQSLVRLVDLADRSFPRFSPKIAQIRDRTPLEDPPRDTLATGPGSTKGQLALILTQLQQCIMLTKFSFENL